MDLASSLWIKNATRAAQHIKNNLVLLISSMLLDLAFFFSLGFFTTPIKDKLVEQAVSIASVVSDAAQAGARQNPSIFNQLLSSAAKPLIVNAFILFLALVVVTYIIYVIFQGSAWTIAKKITAKKVSWSTYMKGFAKINIIWAIVYLLYLLIDLIVALRHRVIEAITKVTVTNVLGGVLFIVAGIVIIIALLSYPSLRIRDAWKHLRNVKQIWPAIGLIIVLFLVIDFILTQLLQINFTLTVVVGILLVLPLLAWARAYLTFMTD